MRLILSVFTFGVLFSAQAQDRNLTFFEVDKESAGRYPVLQCPASDESLKDFRSKLLGLKNAIKAEAANCAGIGQNIDGLADLVTKDREKYLELVTKGQVEGLSKPEQDSIEKYVTDLTIKTSTLISILAGEDGCFDEDKKGQSTEFIASLLGEGAKILSVVAGPQIGGLAAVASEVISGFSNAMKVINKSAQGYKFSVDEQKIAYADSLCALFDYRRELDNLMSPYETSERLSELVLALNKQLLTLKRNCVECADLIAKVDLQTALATRNGAVELTNVGEIWTGAFEKEISDQALAIDQLFTNKLGTHTYRALKTRTWLPIRARSVETSALTADLGLESVLSELDNIERFMIDDQADNFIAQLASDAKEWRNKINSYFVLEGAYLTMDLNFYVPQLDMWTATQMDHYGAILETLEEGAARSKDSRVKSRVRSFMASFRLLSQGLNVSIDVANKYCKFFENSNWYRSKLVYACPNSRVADLEQDALLFTNYRLMMPSYDGSNAQDIAPQPAVAEGDIEVTADWVEALTLSIREMSTRPNYVVRESSIGTSKPPL